jgi:hypothetical protein
MQFVHSICHNINITILYANMYYFIKYQRNIDNFTAKYILATPIIVFINLVILQCPWRDGKEKIDRR